MVNTGRFFLYDAILPPLKAGGYTLETTLGLTATTGSGSSDPTEIDPLASRIEVTAPRFRLPPDQALMTFPPANSEGSYDATLPQIVLKRRTLPWDRQAGPTGTIHGQPVTEKTPWLALVIIAEGEGDVIHDAPVAECVTPGVTLTGKADVVKSSYLKVPASTVKAVFPTIEDLSLLAHVREVSLDDTELAMGDDDGFLAVIIANRLPQFDQQNCRPKAYTACLINLEGQLGELPAPIPPNQWHFPEQVYLSDVAERYVRSLRQGLAVPVIDSGQPRMLDTADPAALTDAIRRGEVVFHDNQLIDRAGMTPDGLAVIGRLDATALLDGDLGGVSTRGGTLAAGGGGFVADNARRAVGIFDSFEMSVELFYPAERILRFPVLTSWRFTCSGAGSFAQLMEDLDIGLLGTPIEGAGWQRQLAACVPAVTGDSSGAPPAAQLPLTVAETGHVGLPHLSRTGLRGEAWYRGPFSPHQLLRNPLAGEAPLPVLAHVSDHLRMMTPDGRQDVSLAVAFETGRLLAMSQPSFVAGLMRWRDERFGAARARTNQRLTLIDRLNLFERLIDPRDLNRLIDAMRLDVLPRVLEDQVFRSIDARRDGVICGTRPIADPGLRVEALQGDLTAILADGLGINRSVLSRIALAPGAADSLAALQASPVGLVSTGIIDIGGAAVGGLDVALDVGLTRIGELALGQAAIRGGFTLDAVKNTPLHDSFTDFLNDRIEEIGR